MSTDVRSPDVRAQDVWARFRTEGALDARDARTKTERTEHETMAREVRRRDDVILIHSTPISRDADDADDARVRSSRASSSVSMARALGVSGGIGDGDAAGMNGTTRGSPRRRGDDAPSAARIDAAIDPDGCD